MSKGYKVGSQRPDVSTAVAGIHVTANSPAFKRTISGITRITAVVLFVVNFAICSEVYAARPLVTEDAVVAGKGVSQLEAGVDFIHIDDVGEGTTLVVTPIFGIDEFTEFSLKVPYISTNPKHGSGIEGWGDISFIMKHLFVAEREKTPAFLVKLSIKLPTGDEDEGLGTGETNVGFLGVITKNFHRSTLHLNAGYTFVGRQGEDDYGDKNEVNYGMGVEYRVTGKINIVGEAYGLYYPDYEAEDIERRAMLGLMYRLDDTYTLDFGVKRGLEGADDEQGITAGLTVTF